MVDQLPQETDCFERLRVLSAQKSLNVLRRNEQVVQLGLQITWPAENNELVLDGNCEASALRMD